MARNPQLQRAQARALIDAILTEAITDDPEASPTIAELIDSAAGGRSKSDYVRQLISETGLQEAGTHTADERRAINDRLNFILLRAQQRQIDTMLADGRAFDAEIRHRLTGAASDVWEADARAAEAESDLLHTKVGQEVAERLLGIASTVHRAPLPFNQSELSEPPVAKTPPRSKPAKAKTLSAYQDSYGAWRLAGSTTHQVLGQEMATFKRFMEVAGDRLPTEYHRGNITEFIAKMRRLPQAYGKSKGDHELSLDEIVSRAVSKGKPTGLSDKTLKRHLSTLSQIFMHVVNDGAMTLSQRNELVKEHSFKATEAARDQRDSWTSEDLAKLFTSPVWSGCEGESRRSAPGNQILRDARFWLPLLALFHGARLEEFADLYRRDVTQIDGIWAVRITTSEADEETGRAARRLKTFAAKRVIPLHPEIIRLGFIIYVQETAKNPGDPLFPDLTPEGQDQKRGPQITRWFGRYRQQIKVFRPGVGMHAFRHLVATRLTDAGVDVQHIRNRDYLLGHAPSGTEGDTRYDKGPGLRAVAETLALLQYPELDLSHLYVG